MKHSLIALSLLLSLLLGGCKKDEPELIYQRTVLVYMAANNSLSQFVSDDIAEMKRGVAALDNDRAALLVYVKGQSNSRLIRIKKGDNGQGVEEVVHEYPDANSLDVATMSEIIGTAFSQYRAESYGLVLWSHGDGWIPSPSLRWWGQDGNSYMSIASLEKVLKTLPTLNFLYFDACFMQAAEVAYDLRHYTDYLIGCPTETPGPGAPYDKVVPHFFATSRAAVAIAEAYFQHYEALYDEGRNISNNNWTGGASISVIRAPMMEVLAEATTIHMTKYITGGAPIDESNVQRYDRRNNLRYYYDLDRLAYSLTGGNANYIAWKKAFVATQVYWKSTPMNYSAFGGMFTIDQASGGLSTYIPRASSPATNSFYQGLAWYTAAGWTNTGW